MPKLLANVAYYKIMISETSVPLCIRAQKLKKYYQRPSEEGQCQFQYYLYYIVFIITYIYNSSFITVWLNMYCTVVNSTPSH